ncbi:hypothetical protein HEP81_08150 (plasmid) [Streptomyces griseofuscus]|uniref:Uncharacterized protein n=1 Tax=Streptomyces griseofuscus TaxID=146922 RepID=A0A7H1QDJ8_9ACTN|nr:hypothetical protein [Streptomyces griseofuscus]QNT98378.1 hypothetical protein HEP81_08150 [Streptomyces griseofuscus]
MRRRSVRACSCLYAAPDGDAVEAVIARRRGGGRYADPGFVRSLWLPWLFTTGQGIAYSSARRDANVFVLIVGWAPSSTPG